MHLWRVVRCLSPQLGDLGAINGAVFDLCCVPSAVQMIVLDVVLLSCFRAATPYFFPGEAKTKDRMCFLVPSDMAAVVYPGLAHPLVMEGAGTDQASLSHRAFLAGLRGGGRLRSPCPPHPAAAWHRAGAVGSCPDAAVPVSGLARLLLSLCNFPAPVREKSLGVGQPPATWGFAVCSLCSHCVSFLCLGTTEHCSVAVEVSLILTGSVDEVFHVALGPAALQGHMSWPVYGVLACIYKACENFSPNLPNKSCFDLFKDINVLYLPEC